MGTGASTGVPAGRTVNWYVLSSSAAIGTRKSILPARKVFLRTTLSEASRSSTTTLPVSVDASTRNSTPATSRGTVTGAPRYTTSHLGRQVGGRFSEQPAAFLVVQGLVRRPILGLRARLGR